MTSTLLFRFVTEEERLMRSSSERILLLCGSSSVRTSLSSFGSATLAEPYSLPNMYFLSFDRIVRKNRSQTAIAIPIPEIVLLPK